MFIEGMLLIQIKKQAIVKRFYKERCEPGAQLARKKIIKNNKEYDSIIYNQCILCYDILKKDIPFFEGMSLRISINIINRFEKGIRSGEMSLYFI